MKDLEALCAHIARRGAPDLSWHDAEDLRQFLLVEAWQLSERFEPGRAGGSFNAFASSVLRRRVVDWRRQRDGRTVWKFRDTVHIRERPQFLSIDDDGAGLGELVAGSSLDDGGAGFADELRGLHARARPPARGKRPVDQRAARRAA